MAIVTLADTETVISSGSWGSLSGREVDILCTPACADWAWKTWEGTDGNEPAIFVNPWQYKSST